MGRGLNSPSLLYNEAAATRPALAAVALDATVVVFAEDPGKWGPHSRFIQSARPDQRGRFTIKGLPPGEYVATAVGYLEPGEERDPDLLEAWRKRGTRFVLSEGETRGLDLNLSKF